MCDYGCQNTTIIDGHFHRFSPGGFGQKVNLLITFFFLFRYVQPRFDLILSLYWTEWSDSLPFFIWISVIQGFLLFKFVAILLNAFHIYKIISWIEISFVFVWRITTTKHNAKCGGCYGRVIECYCNIQSIDFFENFSIHLFVYSKWNPTLMNLENQDKILPT